MKPLHDKKHTLAKRGLSLLCVLALCLGLLPVTALAAEEDKPGTLWVGQTQITAGGYWKTTAAGKLESGSESDYNVHYDGNGTLTLNNAKIQGRGYSGNPQPEDYGIYAAPTGNQSVSLTINLIGSNTVSGYCGICVETTTADNASLVIQPAENDPQGSLEAIGSKYNGITISSGSGNASLTINNAPVVAISKSPAPNSYHGVCIKTGIATAPALSLLVNGGSLTAQGESGYGIYFYMRDSTTDPSTSLTVQNNALVKATPSIVTSNNLSKPDTTAGSESGGIVFDGKNGTVYGDVELQDDLEIGTDETLTIPDGSSLDTNGNLTNSGTIINNGTLTGEVGGSGTVTPKITTDSLPNGTVGESYTATLEATGNNITWSASGLPDGLTLNESTGTISGTPTKEGTFNFTVTATNSAGNASKEYTLNIKSATVPVTRVTLNPSSLSLFTGGSETLTATVEPGNATNKTVTWSSSDNTVATVDNNGNVTAVKAGTAAITATAEDDSNISATCMVTVIDKTYTISADPTALNFGSAYTGYTQPAAQTVTVKNTGNQPVTLTQPASTNSFEVGTLSTTNLAVGETATFTVQPKAGLSAGTYSDTITVSGTNNATLSIIASFAVKSQPSYNPPTVSEKTIDAIQDAEPGETVTVDLSHGSTKLDKEVFETLAGQDITLVIDLGDGLSWTVNGMDIPEDADFVDIDMGVTMDSDGIPVDLINAITGEHGSVQMTLAHDGAFGFTMTLTAQVGAENAGYWANLYHFNEEANTMTFETAAQIGDDGSVSLPLSHASQYAIVIDDHNHGVVTLPFTDVSEGDWFYDPVCFVYENGLMTGTSADTFEPNTPLSRAMLVAVLHRVEGSPAASGGDFTDVADGDWYAQAVNWAASVGVVNGFDDGTFQPNTAITREQLAAILRNYAAYKGLDVSASGDLSAYTDANSVSDWAKESVTWAVGEHLISGITDDTLAPQACATRAQVAAILQRFLSE